MKKIFLPVLLLLIVPILYAMPPMPGSGLTHDGSIREGEEFPVNFYSQSLSSDNEVRQASAKTSVSASTTGNKTILVVLADYPDLPFNYETFGADTHDEAYYDKLLQAPSGLTMQKYYYEQSRNKLNLSFHVIGPYTATYGYAHYGANDSLGNDIGAAELVSEILGKINSSAVPAGMDNCTVIIVHSGQGEEAGTNKPPLYADAKNCIWSHRDKISKHGFNPVEINGTTYDDYLIVPEYSYFNGIFEATIGVFCHEFGHILGLPDAYDTYYATTGVGQWSLMAGGSWGSMGKAGIPGSDPAPFMAWELLALGWIEEEEITPDSGSAVNYTFPNINDAQKVYSVKLTEDQYLILEGKAENVAEDSMYVMESGLMITHIHKGILSKYWSANRINSGSYRPHGAMVVEAEAANYKINGLGNLWRSANSDSNRFTTKALFRSDTLTSVSPASTTAVASGFLIGILAAWYRGRKKLCAFLAVAALAAFISMGCVISAGGGGGTYDTGPNTNYYTNMTNVHSKTGNSGISIYNIKCNSDGSGSFTIRREE